MLLDRCGRANSPKGKNTTFGIERRSFGRRVSGRSIGRRVPCSIVRFWRSTLLNRVGAITAASRPCEPSQVRSRFIVTPWQTDKQAKDGIWERFATVSAGTGQKLSNQRGLRRSEYIEKFEAKGSITFDQDYVNPATLEQAIAWGGKFVGIGASRKMGWGRFELKQFV